MTGPTPAPPTGRTTPRGTRHNPWPVIGSVLFVVLAVGGFFLIRGMNNPNGNEPRFESFTAALAPYKGASPVEGLVLGDGSALSCKPGLNKAWFGPERSGQPSSIEFENGDVATAQWGATTVTLTIQNQGGVKGAYPAGYFNGEGASQGFGIPKTPDGAKELVFVGHFGPDSPFVGVASARGAVLCTNSALRTK